MTIYELLSSNQSLLNLMLKNSIKRTDMEYIGMMDDYKKMRMQRQKVGYIVNFLADKYGISVRTVFNVVKKMSSRVKT